MEASWFKEPTKCLKTVKKPRKVRTNLHKLKTSIGQTCELHVGELQKVRGETWAKFENKEKRLKK